MAPRTFRSLEISDARFERDHLRYVTVETPSLAGRGDILFFVPPGVSQAGTPLAILLHGSYGSHWAWAFQGGVHITALLMMERGEIPPMVLAMPSDGLRASTTAY